MRKFGHVLTSMLIYIPGADPVNPQKGGLLTSASRESC